MRVADCLHGAIAAKFQKLGSETPQNNYLIFGLLAEKINLYLHFGLCGQPLGNWRRK